MVMCFNVSAKIKFLLCNFADWPHSGVLQALYQYISSIIVIKIQEIGLECFHVNIIIIYICKLMIESNPLDTDRFFHPACYIKV